MAFLGVSLKNNKEQQELARLMYENNRPIIMVEGAAGTGKTFATLVTALQLQAEKKYQKIIYIRDAIQVGHDIGHLPGNSDEKMMPYWGPVYDSLDSIRHISKENLNVKDLASKIEVVPLAFTRGRSFTNSIVIVDEAESMDLNALKTVLTRIDRWSKIVLLGSYKQIDDWRIRQQDKSDFQKVIEVLQDQPYVGFIRFTRSMRSDWTVEIDELLDTIDREPKPITNEKDQ